MNGMYEPDRPNYLIGVIVVLTPLIVWWMLSDLCQRCCR